MSRLQVCLYGRQVGYLEREGGSIRFWFSRDYLDAPDRPVLGQWFETRLGGDRVFADRRGRLLGFFRNLVPERGGRLRKLLAREFGVDEDDDFDLLAALGSDLTGAVTVIPGEGGLERPASTVHVGNGHGGLNRFSLGGLQLKFTMSRGTKRFTIPARDEDGDWIVKITGPAYPEAAENEVAMMSWARGAGFDVPDCEVVPAARLPARAVHELQVSHAYAVRRFDRTTDGRLQQEDFCQVYGWGPEQKDNATYRHIGIAGRNAMGPECLPELVRRAVFEVASGNCDAHLKNWSLLYADPIRPGWAPLYDQVSTVAWPSLDPSMTLKLGRHRDLRDIARADVQQLGREVGLDDSVTDGIVDATLEALRSAWESGDGFGLPGAHRAALSEHWSRVPLVRDSLGHLS